MRAVRCISMHAVVLMYEIEMIELNINDESAFNLILKYWLKNRISKKMVYCKHRDQNEVI